MTGGNWIALAGVVVTAGSAVFTVVQARRARTAARNAATHEAKTEEYARRATDAAENAATSQAQSADAARRAAEALETQNQIAAAAHISSRMERATPPGSNAVWHNTIRDDQSIIQDLTQYCWGARMPSGRPFWAAVTELV